MPASLPRHLAKSSHRLHRRDDDGSGQGTVGRGRPRDRDRGQLNRARRDHADARSLDPPAAAEIEAFLMDVPQPPFVELGLRPAFRLPHPGRIGHARADDVGEMLDRRHDLRMVEALVHDPRGVAGHALRHGGNGNDGGRGGGEQIVAQARSSLLVCHRYAPPGRADATWLSAATRVDTRAANRHCAASLFKGATTHVRDHRGSWGQVAEWLKAADCKSARASVRWFESSPVHQNEGHSPLLQ